MTAGTVFHKMRKPLVNWYWLIYHMGMNKVGVSIAEVQRVLDIRDCKTAWLLAHKVRKAMADRDAQYGLVGLVEMDDSFFGPRGVQSLQAQPYPSHPIQLVIPGAPGDAGDIAARLLMEELSKILQTSIVAVNKPGGAAAVGTDFVDGTNAQRTTTKLPGILLGELDDIGEALPRNV